MGNKRLPLVVYICVQPMLYPYAIGVGRVVLSITQAVQSLTSDKTIHATTLEPKCKIYYPDNQIRNNGNSMD